MSKYTALKVHFPSFKKRTKEGEILSQFLCSKKQNQVYSRSFDISIITIMSLVEQYQKIFEFCRLIQQL